MAIHSPLDDPKQIFLDHCPLIERAARHACRGVHLQPQEVEDFVSCVRLKFMENDYEVIRKYQGRSKIETYLVTCARNYFKDHLNHLWGKWRPSAEATRLAERVGRVAIDLERLLCRDGLTQHEAIETLLTNHRVKMSRRELEDLAILLPPRIQRRPEGEEVLDQMPAPGEQPEERILDQEREERRRRALEALDRARQTLPLEDRTILRLRHDEGFSIATIACRLGIEPKPLYRRLDRIYKTLRELLRKEGFAPEDLS